MNSNRKLVLDTETTGLNFEDDKIIEVGIVELIDGVITQNNFHKYINPKKDISVSAQKIHGLSNKFLSDKPFFSEIADELLNFIKDDTLIIHNAEFDLKFLNTELENCGFAMINNSIIDTLSIAKKQFPGQTVNLDALCRKLDVVNTRENFHGALLDANLLSKVYLKLTTGKQENLNLHLMQRKTKNSFDKQIDLVKEFSKSRKELMSLSKKEQDIHSNFINEMKNPIWNKIRKTTF